MARSRNGVTRMRNKRIRPTRSRSSSSYTSSLMGRDLFTADVSFGSSFFGTSSSSTEPAPLDDRWEEDASGINSGPIVVHGGIEVRNGKFVYQENAVRSIQVAGPAMGVFGEEDSEEPAALEKASSGKIFAPKPGETHTFLDKEYGSTIPSRREGRFESVSSIEEAVRLAADEIRSLARGYYSNYDELKKENQMLPEAGVRVLKLGVGRYNYAEIVIGHAQYGEYKTSGMDDLGQTLWKNKPNQYKHLAARFHMHWIDLSPSPTDEQTDKNIAYEVEVASGEQYQAWVGSYSAESQYFWRG